MLDFYNRNKVFIIVVFATIVLIAAGIFLMTRGNSSSSSSSTSPVDTSKLVSPNSYITSGFVDGNYLPATTSATTTLVEFGDYECPACGVYAPYVKQLLTDFAGKINFVFRNYPLSEHSNALISAYAVEAAGRQRKYWQMHEKVYATQSDWVNLSDPKSVFIGYAKNLGLDVNKFTADMNSSQIKDIVQNDVNDGNAVGLTETPTFYLNNLKLNLTGSYDQFKNFIQLVVPK
jgi:protein-disulfide isomerase